MLMFAIMAGNNIGDGTALPPIP